MQQRPKRSEPFSGRRTVYPSDLTDAQWERVCPLLPRVKPGGRPASVPRRELLNAKLYVLRSRCAWRMLPHDFPPWSTAYHYFRAWRLDGTWERIQDALRE
jgi:transposase